MGVTNSPIFESLVKSNGQQGGFKIEAGRATFTGTATSENLKTHMHKVLAVVCTSAAVLGSGDTPYWDQASSTTGEYTVPSTGVIVVKRETGTTSGLAFSYLIIGL